MSPRSVSFHLDTRSIQFCRYPGKVGSTASLVKNRRRFLDWYFCHECCPEWHLALRQTFSESKKRRSTIGVREGRPWAHWNGRLHRDRAFKILQHSALSRTLPNLIAPWQACELRMSKTTFGQDMALRLVVSSVSVCSLRSSCMWNNVGNIIKSGKENR